MITILDKELMREIMLNPRAYKLLRIKAKYEQMGLHAVLKEWGDPRKWPAFKED